MKIYRHQPRALVRVESFLVQEQHRCNHPVSVLLNEAEYTNRLNVIINGDT